MRAVAARLLYENDRKSAIGEETICFLTNGLVKLRLFNVRKGTLIKSDGGFPDCENQAALFTNDTMAASRFID
jgi:hypothetical protein